MPPRVVGAGIAALICCAIALTAAATADAEGPPIAPDAPETPYDGTLEYRIFDYRWEDRQEVQVFHTWDTACASPPAEGASIPSTGPVPASTMTGLLRASLEDINEALRGAVVLVDAGQAPAGAQCQEPRFFGTNPYDIVVGWAPLAQGAGLASTSIDHRNQIIGARVVLDPRLAWACPDDPPHRDAQHTITHELLHALGVDHSDDASAIMFRSFTVCHAELLLQPDDRAALAELYPVTTASNTTAPPPPSSTSYVGLAVTQTGGGPADLVAHLATEGCSAQALAITSGGRWVVYVNGAPSFANAAFPATLAAMSPYFYRCA